jgi:hypothetical protein
VSVPVPLTPAGTSSGYSPGEADGAGGYSTGEAVGGYMAGEAGGGGYPAVVEEVAAISTSPLQPPEIVRTRKYIFPAGEPANKFRGKELYSTLPRLVLM